MTTELRNGEGNVLARDLTVAELEALAAAGVTIETTEGDDTPQGDGDAAPDDAVIDDLQDHLSEMDDAADDDDAGDWWDAGDYDDYSTTDDIDDGRLADLRERLRDSKTDIGQLRDERDAREHDDDSRYYATSDEIRSAVQDSELVEELTTALRELTTADRDEPATSGHSLNIEGVVRQRAGSFSERKLYIDRDTAESGDRAVSVALDLSGSMNERTAKIALAALAEATSVIGDSLIASGFTDNRSRKLPLITGPDEEFEYDHLDSVRTGGGTPTADGIKAAGDRLKTANKPEKLVVCITDGKANKTLADGDSTGDADDDVRHVIHAVRANGAKVIGLGVDAASPSYMAELFGDDFVTTGMDDLVEALVEIYRRQLSTTDAGRR